MIPKCKECSLYKEQEIMFYGYCNALKKVRPAKICKKEMRIVLTKERGATSPRWCPKRK